jgi:hypothetical protein
LNLSPEEELCNLIYCFDEEMGDLLGVKNEFTKEKGFHLNSNGVSITIRILTVVFI